MIAIAFKGGRAHYDALRRRRVGAILNGSALRRFRLVRTADDRRVGGAILLRKGGGLGRAGRLYLQLCVPALQRRRNACRGPNGPAARRAEEGGNAAMGGLCRGRG